MSISEDQSAALEAEVAEVLGILESLPAEEEDGFDHALADTLHRYAQQAENISVLAGSAGLPRLQTACLDFQALLTTLSQRHPPSLSFEERGLLEEWPMLVMNYLMAPDDPESDEVLLTHLQNPVWSAVLSAEEPEISQGTDSFTVSPPVSEIPLPISSEPAALTALAEPADTVPEQAPTLAAPVESIESTGIIDESPALPALWAPTPQAVDTPRLQEDTTTPIEPTAAAPTLTVADEADDDIAKLLQPPVENEASVEVHQHRVETPITFAKPFVPVIESEESGTDSLGLFDQDQPPSTAEILETPRELAKSEPTEELDRAVEVPVTAQDELKLDVTDAAPRDLADEAIIPVETIEEAFAEIPESPVMAPLETTAEETSSEIEEESEQEEADGEDEEDEEDEDEEFQAASRGMAQQELLEILSTEVAQIAETTDEAIAIASSAESTPADRAETLLGQAENLERLGDAANSIGLIGLQHVCAHLQANITALANQQSPLRPEQQPLLGTWPGLVFTYLQALEDRDVCTTLVQHLQDSHWSTPLVDPTAATALIDLLVAPKLITEDADAEARPQQAQPEDVSLQLPADVNQQLLDGLLQELPHQAADFSAAIQRLSAGHGTLKDVEVAQRIAHTLKGAGNTVGVRGIATLTHQVEDILQALSKQGVLPNRALAGTLLDTADCLEMMSEALLGMSAPPSQALDVLQQVLNWANRIDRHGVPPTDDVSAPEAKVKAATEESTAPASSATSQAAPATTTDTTASTPDATLRIPAHLVDDLLRLVGESIILTGQVQERVRKTIAQTKALLGQNRTFQQLTSELEQLVDVRNVSSPLSRSIQRGDFDPLELEQYNELNTVTHRLVESSTDARELNRVIEDNLAALDALLVDQSRLHRTSQEAVLRTRMVPIQTVVPRLQRSVRQTCRLVNKEVDLLIRGADTLVDSNVLNSVIDPLMHILRNAIDHGIESPEQRERLGKPSNGRINLDFAREGNNIVIRCQDDGAGLNLLAIRKTAEDRGLLTPDKTIDEDALTRLILLPGFSTAGKTTQTSGRGIGMDVVYSSLLEMKGSLRIQTKTGQGCLIELRLPVTLISTHALLLRMRNQMYALSDRGIEQILYFGVGKIQTVGTTTAFRIGDEIYELTSLAALLNLPSDRREQERATPPVLLVREEKGTLRAVLVEEILDSRDLVVKNLGRYLPKLEGIVGATILGDGSVAPVLDLPELLRSRETAQRPRLATRTDTPTDTHQHRQIVLAVDDSLSARRSMAQFVQDAGFEVRTARDGLEAIEIINKKCPDLILADLEMPRMNGLELTAHLRSNSATQAVPVIMITSRSTDKHRHEAEAMGVNVYLTKPFVEDELLGHMQKLLQPA